MNNNNAEWLGLEDVLLEKVSSSEDILELSISLPRVKHQCPRCGEETDRVSINSQ